MTLTDKKIEALKPASKRYPVHDERGLYLEVWPSGAKSWRFRYFLHGHRRRINLGRFPEVSLAAARVKRNEMASAIRAGNSPAEARRKQKQEMLRGLTVREFGERYLCEVVKQNRKDSAPMRRYLERDVYPALGSMPMVAVRAGHVRELLYAIRGAGHRQAARALHGLLKRVWEYAIECDVVTVNPILTIRAKYIAVAEARSRALSEDEIGNFLRRLDIAPMRGELKIALRLILLTLTRKSELRLARWGDIDLERGEWEIPPEHSKTGKGQIVYLSRQAQELFMRMRPLSMRPGRYVFPALGSDGSSPIGQSTLNRALGRVQRGMVHFTVHDLRRTGATRLSEMNFSPEWIEKALNHKLGGVRGIYNRAEYGPQRRKMLQVWADAIDSLQGVAKAA